MAESSNATEDDIVQPILNFPATDGASILKRHGGNADFVLGKNAKGFNSDRVIKSEATGEKLVS